MLNSCSPIISLLDKKFYLASFRAIPFAIVEYGFNFRRLAKTGSVDPIKALIF
ncbi:MAG: hypothetical protein QW265_05415 [Candidatus Bathyarchaeia archaeon]